MLKKLPILFLKSNTTVKYHVKQEKQFCSKADVKLIHKVHTEVNHSGVHALPYTN